MWKYQEINLESTCSFMEIYLFSICTIVLSNFFVLYFVFAIISVFNCPSHANFPRYK